MGEAWIGVIGIVIGAVLTALVYVVSGAIGWISKAAAESKIEQHRRRDEAYRNFIEQVFLVVSTNNPEHLNALRKAIVGMAVDASDDVLRHAGNLYNHLVENLDLRSSYEGQPTSQTQELVLGVLRAVRADFQGQDNLGEPKNPDAYEELIQRLVFDQSTHRSKLPQNGQP